MTKKLFFLFAMAAACSRPICAQTFSSEFSAEMQTDERFEVAPQLKAILELPLGKAWSMEMELASSQAGLDYRVDAKREVGSVLSLLAGASSADACQLHFIDLGLAAAWEKWEATAIFHYAPYYSSQDKCLELTFQRNFSYIYLQPGLFINHANRNFSFTPVITLGISLDIR